MIKEFCNRCKKELDRLNHGTTIRLNQRLIPDFSFNGDEYHFCDSCRRSVLEFINGQGIKDE